MNTYNVQIVTSVNLPQLAGTSLVPDISCIKNGSNFSWLQRFSSPQLPYCLACSKLATDLCIQYIYIYIKFKIGNCIQIKCFLFYRSLLLAVSRKIEINEDPFSCHQPHLLLNKQGHTRNDCLAPQEGRFVLDYCLRNLKRGPDGED